MLLVGGTARDGRGDSPRSRAWFATASVRATSASSDIVVIGAGGWGSFTALNLRKMGAKVTLVDAYGPGNARSTSGDETRGVRSSYGDRPGEQGELWTLWAREAMKKWIAFDDEWGKELRLNLFHVTGDLIMRAEWDNFQLRTKVWWDKNKIPYQVLNPDDVRKAFPVISMDDITAVLYEPDAGVVRARRAAQAAAAAFEHLGGKIMIGRATPSKIANGKLQEITLDTGATLRADTFVWAVGPWMGKTFPELLAKKTRVPIGYVCYFATPVNDQRFTYPNLPSYNFPGVTGWPALPVDNRGFRVRGAERAPTPPGEVGAAGRCAGAPRTRAAATRRGERGRRDAARRARARRRSGRAPARPVSGAAADGVAGGGRRWWRRRWRRRRGGGGGGQGSKPTFRRQQQDPDTSDRWADADAHRGVAPLRRASLPAAQGRADRADARVPLRVDVERQLHRRHPSAHVERVDRRRRKRRGLQVLPGDRRVRGAARDGDRGRPGGREEL